MSRISPTKEDIAVKRKKLKRKKNARRQSDFFFKGHFISTYKHNPQDLYKLLLLCNIRLFVIKFFLKIISIIVYIVFKKNIHVFLAIMRIEGNTCFEIVTSVLYIENVSSMYLIFH